MSALTTLRDHLYKALEHAGVRGDQPIALAVSGGPDSLALLLAAADRPNTHILTVDHGLRPESAEEAQQVLNWAAGLGMQATRLVWTPPEGIANIQAEARLARYRLMEDYCAATSISYLLTAHHRGDGVETFFLRLARGSGVKGLAAMAMDRKGLFQSHVRLLRPFMDVSKTVMQAVVSLAGYKAFDDSSNHDTRFDRIKVRQWLEAAPLVGLSDQGIVDTAARLERADAALAHYTKTFLTQYVTQRPSAGVQMNATAFAALPVEVALRALSEVIKWVGNQGYRPRARELAPLCEALKADMARRTLAGTVINRAGNDIIMVREVSAMPRLDGPMDGADAGNKCLSYDGKWSFAKGVQGGRYIGPLGGIGWASVKESAQQDWVSALPIHEKQQLPALFEADRVLDWPGKHDSSFEKVALNWDHVA